MQGTWRKIGAALGSAVMLGATFAGAAFAATATKSLGDYKDLMISSDGAVSGLFVVGANAAAADVVSAIDMAAWVSNQKVSGTDTSGQITITPLTTSVKGVKRHVEYDQAANRAYEFGSTTATTDKIGPVGWASGDGVVDFLYSNKEKGATYFNGTEYKWHEEVALTLGNINASRDTLDSNAADKYDEVFVSVLGNTIQYKYQFDTPVPAGAAGIQGKKIWFMGKENAIISARENDVIKLGASDSEVLLTTSNPTTTIGGVDVTLGGVYSVGGTGNYKAKLTLTNGGTSETKYIQADNTDTIAGIEVYVKTAVVTTSGTNEGEAQLIVGAGITKLEDNSYLKKGDGTETTWQTILDNSNSAGYFDDIVVKETNPYTSTSGATKILKPGDSVKFPTALFSLKYTGSEDRYGNAPSYVDVDLIPTTLDFDVNGDQELAVQINTPGGNFIKYADQTGISKTTDKIWLNTSTGVANATNGTWWYKSDNDTSTKYYKVGTTPYVELTPQNAVSFNFTVPNGNYANTVNKTYGRIYISEPLLYVATAVAGANTNNTIIVEYNSTSASVGEFKNITASNPYYVYGGLKAGSTGGTSETYAACSDTSITGATRDFITQWGTYIDSVGSNLVSLKIPKEQLYATLVFGTSEAGKGKSVSVAPGETTTIGGTTVNVTGAVGGKAVTLPASLSKLDIDVTAADKSGYTLVLVGGPKVNTLVNDLQTKAKLTKTIGPGGDISAKGAGVIELVNDAWGTGKWAIVVAGADRAGTADVARMLAKFESYKASLASKTVYTNLEQ